MKQSSYYNTVHVIRYHHILFGCTLSVMGYCALVCLGW